MSMRPPLPPFTHKTAVRKVRLADVLRTRSKLGISLTRPQAILDSLNLPAA